MEVFDEVMADWLSRLMEPNGGLVSFQRKAAEALGKPGPGNLARASSKQSISLNF
ncbi:MAG: hypothetical protein ACKVOO_09720 [Burkholderiaceae bacterium]